MFIEVVRKKLVGGSFCPPPILSRVKTFKDKDGFKCARR